MVSSVGGSASWMLSPFTEPCSWLNSGTDTGRNDQCGKQMKENSEIFMQIFEGEFHTAGMGAGMWHCLCPAQVRSSQCISTTVIQREDCALENRENPIE